MNTDPTTTAARPPHFVAIMTTIVTLLAIVAIVAGILSFDAIRDLARLCGFGPITSALVPIVIDVGAVAASVVWLAHRVAGPAASAYGRRMTLNLIAASVTANAVDHWFIADEIRPTWIIIAVVGGIAPAVLAACVHLIARVLRAISEYGESAHDASADADALPADAPAPADALDEDAPAPPVAIDAPRPVRTSAAALAAPSVTADASVDEDGYTAAVRADALAARVSLEPAPVDEDAGQRRARLSRNRNRVRRAVAAFPTPRPVEGVTTPDS